MTALLLDRDGTLMEDVGYPNDPATVRLIPGAAAAICELHDRHGFRPVIVSNQSGVARGLITLDQFRSVNERFTELFRLESGLTIPAFYCLHGVEEGCACRKPKTDLLRQSVVVLGLSQSNALMIGDKPSDVVAGVAFGAKTVWLSFGRKYPNNETRPDLITVDWLQSDVVSMIAGIIDVPPAHRRGEVPANRESP